PQEQIGQAERDAKTVGEPALRDSLSGLDLSEDAVDAKLFGGHDDTSCLSLTAQSDGRAAEGGAVHEVNATLSPATARIVKVFGPKIGLRSRSARSAVRRGAGANRRRSSGRS